MMNEKSAGKLSEVVVLDFTCSLIFGEEKELSAVGE